MDTIFYQVHGAQVHGAQVHGAQVHGAQVHGLLDKNWAMEKCQGICSYKRTPTFVSLNNKVTV